MQPALRIFLSFSLAWFPAYAQRSMFWSLNNVANPGGAPPSAPVAGYTVWISAKDGSDLFTAKGPCGTGAVDEDLVRCWEHVNDELDVNAQSATDGTRATYEASGIGGFGSAQFSGTSQLLRFQTGASVDVALGSLVTASAKTVYVVFEVSADCSNTTRNSNSGIVTHNSDLFGLVCKTVAAVTSVDAYNADGAVDYAEVVISQGTGYIAEIRHDSGTLYLSIYDLSGSLVNSANVASGDTTATTNPVNIGRSSSTYFTGMVGEVIVYATSLSSGDRSTNVAYLAGVW